MTSTFSPTSPVVRVGIDIAKLTHQILWELPGGKRRSLQVANTKTEIDRFVGMLGALGWPCEIAFEATGQFRGTTRLSKRGNARLRYAFWMAGTVAIRMQQNSFRRKFEDYVRPDKCLGIRIGLRVRLLAPRHCR